VVIAFDFHAARRAMGALSLIGSLLGVKDESSFGGNRIGLNILKIVGIDTEPR
jgi:hypothetical protein